MKYEYIIDDKGYYYVPRPNSVCAGRARHEAFKQKLEVEPAIISPSAWELLALRYETKILEA